MSIASEITRLTTLRNNIRTKLIALGIISSATATLNDCYTGINGVSGKSSTDLTVSGATVTCPKGYYNANASKSVSSGTQGTPTATKSISGTTATITPSCTDTSGYISGTTKSGTAVTVTASELVSGSLSISSNGTYDVTSKASAVVNVPSDTARSRTWDFANRTERKLDSGLNGSYYFNFASPNEYLLYLPTDDTIWINGGIRLNTISVYNKSGNMCTISSITSNGLTFKSGGTTEMCIFIPYHLLNGETFSITYTRSGTNRGGYILCDKHGYKISQELINASGGGTTTWTYTATQDCWLYWELGKYDANSSFTISNVSVSIT